ncbi:choice-of-anchor P family protein [Amycolatopsis sp. NPDC058986]|uniref:choice-of-anchor P family protein n=1 Tax=unclassified Amycolatopsis TaxID=2618356 RepID=UPI003671C593
MRNARKTTRRVLVVTTLAGVLAVPQAAHADPVTSTAWASVGSVDVRIDDQHIVTPELARCTADGPLGERTAGGATGDIAVFGAGDTACGRQDAIALGRAEGKRFQADVLKRFGGPALNVRTFSAKCGTTRDGSLGDVQLGNVTGIKVPENIPANYRVSVPGKAGEVLATVTLNESVVPSPADGSLTTHALHIKLFPKGGPASGDIYLGTARCDPYGKAKAKP